MKNKTIAYVLWILGLHGFYLDKPSASYMFWSSLFISLFLMPFTFGFSIVAFLFVWLADLALIPKWIDEANEKARAENA